MITKWMASVVERSAYDLFPDLHIDEVDPGYRDRRTWADASVALLFEAGRVREELRWSVTVAAGFSLTSGGSPAGFGDIRGVDDVVAATDWSPPSLYVFERGREPWREEENCVATAHVRDQARGVEIFCREWLHEPDREFRRTCWVTTS